MNGKLTLGLLLLMAGGLIYAASHQHERIYKSSQASHDGMRRLSHMHGSGKRHGARQSVQSSATARTMADTTGIWDDRQRDTRVAAIPAAGGRAGGWGMCGSD